MSALDAIIKTYVRFANEQALLALRAHRLKLLVTIDETDAFFSNLRSQCIEELSAIEAGLAKLRPPSASPPPAGLQGGNTEPSAPMAGASIVADSSLLGGAIEDGSSSTETEYGSSPAHCLSSAATNPWNSAAAALDVGHHAVAAELADAPPLDWVGLDTTTSGSEALPDEERGAPEPVFPLQFSPTPASSSFVASWWLQLQDGPSELDQDLLPTGLNEGADGRSSGVMLGWSLFASLDRLADFCLSEGGGA